MSQSGNHHSAFDSDDNCLSAVNRAVLNSFLAAFGHDPRDFEVRVHEHSPIGALLGLDDRLITVRRTSADVEQLYVARSYSSWLSDLIHDVNAGRYGIGAVRRPAPRVRALAAA